MNLIKPGNNSIDFNSGTIANYWRSLSSGLKIIYIICGIFFVLFIFQDPTGIFFIAVVFMVLVMFGKWTVLQKRCEEAGFIIIKSEQKSRILQQAQANPHKSYFQVIQSVKLQSLHAFFDFLNFSFFAQSKKDERAMWVYSMPHVSERQKFFWCLEVQTKKIDIDIIVSRTGYGRWDALDTESRMFEKLYHVTSHHKGKTLQLLDPHMIELITHSNIAAMEFSDSSVVFYSSVQRPSLAYMQNMLDQGYKIAQQVDRNYPAG